MFIAALDKIEACTWNQRKVLLLVFHDWAKVMTDWGISTNDEDLLYFFLL